MLWEAVSEVKSAETSNCGRFWGPLVMVDVEPLSALNHGQTVNTVKYIMWWSSAILGFHDSQPPLHQLLFLFLTQAWNLALRWLISAQTNKQNAIEDLSTCMWVFLQCRLCWPWKLLSVWNCSSVSACAGSLFCFFVFLSTADKREVKAKIALDSCIACRSMLVFLDGCTLTIFNIHSQIFFVIAGPHIYTRQPTC